MKETVSHCTRRPFYTKSVDQPKASYCLGSARRHTVYEGECRGLFLGMVLLRWERRLTEVSICMDTLDMFHHQQEALKKLHHYGYASAVDAQTPRHCRK